MSKAVNEGSQDEIYLSKILQSPVIAREAIRAFGSAKQAMRATDCELQRLGVKKSTLASLRAFQQLSQANDNDCSSAADVVRNFGGRIANLSYEVFAIVGIDSRAKNHGFMQVAQGGIGSVHVDASELFRHALRMSCAALVLMHNHPSGSSVASPEDILLTKRLVECGNILGLPVMDHIVVAANEYTSIQDVAPW